MQPIAMVWKSSISRAIAILLVEKKDIDEEASIESTGSSEAKEKESKGPRI
jgi:hypothetical protein